MSAGSPAENRRLSDPRRAAVGGPWLRTKESVQAENLFLRLRRQLALYLGRGARARRIDPASRVSLAQLRRIEECPAVAPAPRLARQASYPEPSGRLVVDLASGCST